MRSIREFTSDVFDSAPARFAVVDNEGFIEHVAIAPANDWTAVVDEFRKPLVCCGHAEDRYTIYRIDDVCDLAAGETLVDLRARHRNAVWFVGNFEIGPAEPADFAVTEHRTGELDFVVTNSHGAVRDIERAPSDEWSRVGTSMRHDGIADGIFRVYSMDFHLSPFEVNGLKRGSVFDKRFSYLRPQYEGCFDAADRPRHERRAIRGANPGKQIHAEAAAAVRRIRTALLRPVSEGGRGLKPFEIAAAAGVSVQTMRQYCLDPKASGARRIPEGRLARLRDFEQHGWMATQ
ncbi:hypothetical protein [Oricola sp.]|uniref:hypothetical protein n=1 Tax=Oricola sp. TaxID=1979950 RepID=UPI0035189FE0